MSSDTTKYFSVLPIPKTNWEVGTWANIQYLEYSIDMKLCTEFFGSYSKPKFP